MHQVPSSIRIYPPLDAYFYQLKRMEAVDEKITMVKPALKQGKVARGITSNNNKGLQWDEAKIQEHDKLRGTRMKIVEAETPFLYYDSADDSDGSHNASKGVTGLNLEHLQNKLDAAAAVRDANSSNMDDDDAGSDAEEEERKKIKAMEFKEYRKRHYNEMELVRKFRQQQAEGLLDDEDDEDEENNADDEGDL